MSVRLRVINDSDEYGDYEGFSVAWINYQTYCNSNHKDVFEEPNPWGVSNIAGTSFVQFKTEEDMTHFLLKFS